MRDFSIPLTHRPGELGRVANALAKKRVNIKSVAGMTLGTQAAVRIIADDVDAARQSSGCLRHWTGRRSGRAGHRLQRRQESEKSVGVSRTFRLRPYVDLSFSAPRDANANR